MLTINIGSSRLVVATAALLTLTSVAWAAPIPVFNTGVDSLGAVLPDQSFDDPPASDPHYFLVSVPVTDPLSTTTILVRSSAGGYPILSPDYPYYNADNTLSRWIGPYNSSVLFGPVGDYDYRTTFSLAGLNPASALLSGFWATDNEGIDILLNGVSTGNANKILDATISAFNTFHAFSINTGFIPGINTLDFIVHNDGDSTALRVQFTEATADTLEITQQGAPPVPEPGTLALLIAGLVGLGAFLRRRLS